MDLSEAVDEYLSVRSSGGYRPNTLRNDTRTLHALRDVHKGSVLAELTERDVDRFMADAVGRLSPATLNLRLACLRGFFVHCVRRRYITPAGDPTLGRRKYVEARRPRMRVPVYEFGRLLDAAKDPRDRIIVALGLYLLLRESEIRVLRVGDVDLATSTISALIPKSSKSDEMPICEELDRELRRWLTHYAQNVPRSLGHDDALVPARTRGGGQGLVQTAHYSTPHRAVQAALVACGHAVHDPSGKSLQEGVHTLRRSAARARFDALAEQGVDRALRQVQSLLHHSQLSTTERYIGLDSDLLERDEALRGRTMFPAAAAASALGRIESVGWPVVPRTG